MEAIGDIARYQAPKGWQRQENTFGENYAVFYTIPFKEIRVQLNGGSSSIYRTPAEFLNSFSVPTQDQESFVMLRLTQVAGKPISLYERRFKQIKKNPHQLGKQEDTYVREEFCVIPARQRYLVLAYSVMGPDPTRLDIASPEWSALLSSFQLTR